MKAWAALLWLMIGFNEKLNKKAYNWRPYPKNQFLRGQSMMEGKDKMILTGVGEVGAIVFDVRDLCGLAPNSTKLLLLDFMEKEGLFMMNSFFKKNEQCKDLGLHAVKIVKLVVPEIVQYGDRDSVVLDCDFTYGERTPGLMLKWFFRSKTRPVYQWIVSQLPQTIGILRGRVDLTYKASDDPQTMYRALRIVKLDTDLSGEYICVVSTFIDEDFKSGNMTVFVPETSFRLVQNKTDDDTVNVICEADGAYPAPNLTISMPDKHLPAKQNIIEIDGRYSAVTSVTLNDTELPTPTEFICALTIPEVNYLVRKETIYYPGPISTTTEIPTVAGMQLGAAATFKETTFYSALTLATLPAVACILAII